MLDLLKAAGRVANLSVDCHRKAFVGSICVSDNGKIFSSRNGSSSPFCSEKTPSTHAERRSCKRGGRGATVYVARVLRNGELAMARPCPRCLAYLTSMRVKRIYYSINEKEYGVIDP